MTAADVCAVAAKVVPLVGIVVLFAAPFVAPRRWLPLIDLLAFAGWAVWMTFVGSIYFLIGRTGMGVVSWTVAAVLAMIGAARWLRRDQPARSHP